MIPRRPLLVLVTLVLALHALLLAGVSARSVLPGSTEQPQVFETRTVTLAAPEPAAAPVPAARPKVRPPPPTRKPRPRRAPATVATVVTSPVVASPEPAPPAAMPDAAGAPPSPGELLALGASADAPEAPASAAAPLLPDGVAPAPASLPASPPASAPATGAPIAGAEASSAAPAAAQASAAAPATVPPHATPAASAPVQLPPPARLDFEVTGSAKGFAYHASAELLWQHDATSYSAHQEIRVLFLGSRSQDSVGSITAYGLQPQRFGDRSRSERAAHFDFANHRVTFSANTPAAPIEAGAQDRLSVFLQLGGMLAAAPERYPAGTRIAMTTVSARGADVWTFTVEGEQTLDLPIGTLRAVQLQRLPRRDYDQKAQLWLAPSLGYLPVRIRLTEANGDFAELNLQSREAP